MQLVEARASNGFIAEAAVKAKAPALQDSIARVVIGGGYKVEVEIIEVTPAKAKEFLDHMVNNRRPRPKNVQVLTKAMKFDGWVFNGEPLIFDETGMMIDGQHRCLSCLAANRSFVTLVVRGVPRSSFDRLDGGSKRTGGDILGIAGVAHRDLVAAGIALLLNYRDRGVWYEASGGNYSPHEIGASLPLFPGLTEMSPVAQEANRLLGGKGSFWLAARYLTAQKDAEVSRAFFGRLVSGIGLGASDPEHLLRARLLQLRGRDFKLTYPELAALVVNAWNARRKNRRITVLRGLVGDAPVPGFV